MRKALRDYRGRRTQKEMGELYGVTQQTWQYWETAARTPNIEALLKISKDSGISIEKILSTNTT